MLDDFRGIDYIERCTLVGQRFSRTAAVIDIEPGICGMGPRRLDRLGGGVDPGDNAAKPCHRFGKQAAATADIENAQPADAVHAAARAKPPDTVENVVDPHRCEIMKRGHRPVRVPPLRGHRREIIDFFLICRRVHRLAPYRLSR